MKISFGCDHRGFEFREALFALLRQLGHEVVDCGTDSEASCDYPDYIFPAAEKVASGECERGIGVCYTGIGSSIAANKVPGVRAALCHSVKEAELTRQHNDSNMLILGTGFVPAVELLKIVEVWLKTAFEGGRHESRVNKIRDYERKAR